jgi:hypothetical protein
MNLNYLNNYYWTPQVYIEEPYNLESCRSVYADDVATLEHVKKVVRLWMSFSWLICSAHYSSLLEKSVIAYAVGR